jgi:hypothetical protein
MMVLVVVMEGCVITFNFALWKGALFLGGAVGDWIGSNGGS